MVSRILQWEEDKRFDEMRGNLGKLAVFWTFQVSFATYVKQLEPVK